MTTQNPQTPETRQNPQEETPKRRRRSGGRRSKIGSSPNREDYVRLIRAGWSSFSLERYAAYRYGEEITASTFRTYKARMRIEVDPGVLAGAGKDPRKDAEDGTSRVDVMTAREQLVDLQMRRLVIDADVEAGMGKLFNTTGREVSLLSDLLDKVKEDQRDYGILPQVNAVQEVEMRVAAAAVREEEARVPRAQSLAEVLGSDPEKAAQVAQALHNVIPIGKKAAEG